MSLVVCICCSSLCDNGIVPLLVDVLFARLPCLLNTLNLGLTSVVFGILRVGVVLLGCWIGELGKGVVVVIVGKVVIGGGFIVVVVVVVAVIIGRALTAVTIFLLLVALRLIALSVLGISASSTSSSIVATASAASTSTTIRVAAVVVAATVVVLATTVGARTGWVSSAATSTITRISLRLVGRTSWCGTTTLLTKTVLLFAIAGVLVDLHGIIRGRLGVDDEAHGWGSLSGGSMALPVDFEGDTVGHFTVEGLDHKLGALAVDKDHFSHDGFKGEESAGVHLAAHIEHDRFNVGGSRAQGEVLGHDDVWLGLRGAADAEVVCSRRSAGWCTTIALGIGVGLAGGWLLLLLLWVCVARIVVVIGVGLAWAVGARVGGRWWACSGAWGWSRVGAWD